METKQYLSKIRYYDRMIRNKFEEMNQIKGLSLSLSVPTDKEKVQSSGDKDKIGKSISIAVDLENEIEEIIKKRAYIVTQISQMEDADYYDVLAQKYILGKIPKEIFLEDVKSIIEEKENLKKLINEKLWDDGTKFYYDLWEDNNLNMVKTAGAYWALLADVVPADKKDDFVEHLRNENEFNRFNRVPTLSADNEDYCEKGNYWCGSVWAPTNYMILKGLDENGYYELCYEIAKNCVKSERLHKLH